MFDVSSAVARCIDSRTRGVALRENLFLPPIPCPGCITLQNLAAKVVQENFKEVAFQEEFLSLSLDQVVPYIASDQIDIDCEKDVFDVSDDDSRAGRM